MNNEPIIIVSGEPNSVFLEIFFKSLKSNKYKSPLIIICSKRLLEEQMKILGFFFEINATNLKSITYLKTSKIIQSNLVFSDGFIYFISKNKIYKI